MIPIRNIKAKILKKILAKQIQQFIRKIILTNQVKFIMRAKFIQFLKLINVTDHIKS